MSGQGAIPKNKKRNLPRVAPVSPSYRPPTVAQEVELRSTHAASANWEIQRAVDGAYLVRCNERPEFATCLQYVRVLDAVQVTHVVEDRLVHGGLSEEKFALRGAGGTRRTGCAGAGVELGRGFCSF